MIKICFVGDIMLGRYHNMGKSTFADKLERNNAEEIFGTTLNILNSADIVVGNLETSITRSDNKFTKVFNYKFDPIYTHLLKLNNNTFLSIANNHILDYEEQGLRDTIKYLKYNGIRYAGAGENIYEAKKYVTYTIKNKKIRIFACADHYYNWGATTQKPGVFLIDYDDYTGLLKYIKELKNNADVLIMSIHWGGNYVTGVNDKYKTFAKKIIMAGVDIIHGHSAHHVKCIDKTDKYIIIYSNGDFVDDYAIDRDFRNDLGMIVSVTINDKYDVQVIPTIIKNQQVNILTDTDLINKVKSNTHTDCN